MLLHMPNLVKLSTNGRAEGVKNVKKKLSTWLPKNDKSKNVTSENDNKNIG